MKKQLKSEIERIVELIENGEMTGIIWSCDPRTLEKDTEKEENNFESASWKIWRALMAREDVEWVNIDFGPGSTDFQIFWWTADRTDSRPRWF